MPPLIVAVLLGAGAYAGFKAVRHLLSRNAGSAGGVPPATDETSNHIEPEKDLGRLELDPATGVYRPAPPLR